MSAASEDPIIGLNIGGQVYLTTQSTLNRSDLRSKLHGSLLQQRARDAQGNFFFDMDGVVFRHILNYLRTGELSLPENFEEFDLLMVEEEVFELGDHFHELLVRAKRRAMAKKDY